MSGTGTRTELGFTLLELIIVIALLTTLVAAGAQFLPPSRANVDRYADRVEKRLLRARLDARLQGIAVAVPCRELDGTARRNPDGITTRCMRGAITLDEVSFFPDGSSSGGTVEISSDTAVASLSIDWLTGGTHRE